MKTHASGGLRAARSAQSILWLVWSHSDRFVKCRVLLALTLVIVASVLAGLGPIALKMVVDRLTGVESSIAVPVLLLISLYILSQWLSRGVGEIRGFVYARAERQLFRSLSESLFSHVMHLPLRFHLERQTGAIAQTLENGLQGFRLILHHAVLTVIPVAVELGTVVVVLLAFDQPVFLAIFCASVVCYAVAFSVFAFRIASAAETASGAHVSATAEMTDSILNYETVKLFAAEPVVLDRVRQKLKKTEDEWVGFYRRYAHNGFGVATIFATFLAISIFYAAHQVQNGRMTIGDFVLVNTYMLQLMRPVEMLGSAMQGISQGVAMLKKLLELFAEAPEPSDAKRNATDATGSASLEFRNVSLAYHDGRRVLTDISFKLEAGRTLGIVGASGAGKSTLVRLLTRLIEPAEGSILVDGIPTSELPLRDLRNAIAVVPQDTVLFNDTIGYNIAFGRPECSQSEIEHAAKLAQLHDFIVKLPEGYATKVGERGLKLSGGERQRIAIARAALKRPRIYVFDEATSSLDSRTEREILANIRAISQSCTTLVIAHRLSTIVHADEIVVLHNGRIVEQGSHNALLAAGGHYAALWRAQNPAAAAAS